MVKVDREFIPIKVLYFLYYGGLASFLPYKSIFQKQLGISTAQNGIIQAIMQLFALLSPPIAGIITDKTKKYKAMLTSVMVFSIVFTVPFYFVPPVEYDLPQKSVTCCLKTPLVAVCQTNLSQTSQCDFDGELQTANTSLQQNCAGNWVNVTCVFDGVQPEVYGSTFAILVVLTALMSFFLAPANPLVDSTAMDTLGKDKIQYFGVQRLWGAVGFGLVGFVVSYLTDLISPVEIYGEDSKNYVLAVASAALFWGLASIIILASVNVSAPKAKGLLIGVGKLFKSPEVIAFLFAVLVSGYSTGVQFAFLFWYLAGLPGFKQYILGLSLLVTCLSEIPMFWFSGWICKKLGYVAVLCLGLCAVSIRFFTYTIITEVWQVLLVEGLHGISFALPIAAMCSYAAVMAPKDAVATLISISQAVYWGIGNLFGALLGGFLYDRYGGKNMFRISCAICFITAVFYWLFFGHPRLVSRCYREESKEKQKKDEAAVTAPEEIPLNIEQNGV